MNQYVKKTWIEGDFFTPEDANAISESLENTTAEITSQASAIETIKQDVASDKQSISALTTSVGQNTSSISTINDTLSKATTDISELQKLHPVLDEIIPAVIADHGSDNPKKDSLVKSFYLIASQAVPNVVNVVLFAKDLEEHTNADSSNGKKGHWIGFAVIPADKTVDGMKYAFGNKELGNKTALENNVDGKGAKGVAFYFDHTEDLYKASVKLRWMKGDTEVGSETIYIVDFGGVSNTYPSMTSKGIKITEKGVKVA